jgi:hypothetical protein
LPRAALGKNLQESQTAAPFFLVCFAYWHAVLTGQEPQLHLEVTGEALESESARLHERRAWIALEALEQGLGDRLRVKGAPGVRWPDQPVFNAPVESRAGSPTGGGGEHRIEVELTEEPAHCKAFSEAVQPLAAFSRQLPLGLFEGQVAERTRWTPGGGAQADLWGTSPDGDVFHLFELKISGNSTVGVLPELLAYLWLVNRARSGSPGGQQATGGGPGLEAARQARRVIGWILAPEVHRLVRAGDRTPLEWIAEGLRDQFDLGVLAFSEEHGGFGKWQPERTWRSWDI